MTAVNIIYLLFTIIFHRFIEYSMIKKLVSSERHKQLFNLL